MDLEAMLQGTLEVLNEASTCIEKAKAVIVEDPVVHRTSPRPVKKIPRDVQLVAYIPGIENLLLSHSETLRNAAEAFQGCRLSDSTFKEFSVAKFIRAFQNCYEYTCEQAPHSNCGERAAEISERIMQPYKDRFATSRRPSPEQREAFSQFCTSRQEERLRVSSTQLEVLQSNMSRVEDELHLNENNLNIFMNLVGPLGEDLETRRQDINSQMDSLKHDKLSGAAKFAESKSMNQTREDDAKKLYKLCEQEEEMLLIKIQTDQGTLADLGRELLTTVISWRGARERKAHALQAVFDIREEAEEDLEKHNVSAAALDDRIVELKRVHEILQILAIGSETLLSDFTGCIRDKCQQLKILLDEYADEYNRIYSEHCTVLERQVKARKDLVRLTTREVLALKDASRGIEEMMGLLGDTDGNFRMTLEKNDENEKKLERLLTSNVKSIADDEAALEAMSANRTNLFSLLGLPLPVAVSRPLNETIEMLNHGQLSESVYTVKSEELSSNISSAQPQVPAISLPDDEEQDFFLQSQSQTLIEGPPPSDRSSSAESLDDEFFESSVPEST